MELRKRLHLGVVHNGVVYLTGQVGTPHASAADQAREVFGKIDALLERVGTDKTRILHVTLWLDDMTHFAEVNGVWDEWMPTEHAPARSSGQVTLATPGLHVEATVIAAADQSELEGLPEVFSCIRRSNSL